MRTEALPAWLSARLAPNPVWLAAFKRLAVCLGGALALSLPHLKHISSHEHGGPACLAVSRNCFQRSAFSASLPSCTACFLCRSLSACKLQNVSFDSFHCSMKTTCFPISYKNTAMHENAPKYAKPWAFNKLVG